MQLAIFRDCVGRSVYRALQAWAGPRPGQGGRGSRSAGLRPCGEQSAAWPCAPRARGRVWFQAGQTSP
eukprot:11227927-Lingulodinium_polyedra.AAC.1